MTEVTSTEAMGGKGHQVPSGDEGGRNRDWPSRLETGLWLSQGSGCFLKQPGAEAAALALLRSLWQVWLYQMKSSLGRPDPGQQGWSPTYQGPLVSSSGI